MDNFNIIASNAMIHKILVCFIICWVQPLTGLWNDGGCGKRNEEKQGGGVRKREGERGEE